MKFLFILLAFTSFAQAPFIQPEIAPDVEQAYKELVDLSKEYQKDYAGALQKAGLISVEVVDQLPENRIGFYERSGSTFKVKILKKLLEDPIALKWTLAHELGHGLKMEHTNELLPNGDYAWCIEIMSMDGLIDKRHILYQIKNHPYHGKDIWKNYFNQIKS